MKINTTVEYRFGITRHRQAFVGDGLNDPDDHAMAVARALDASPDFTHVSVHRTVTAEEAVDFR